MSKGMKTLVVDDHPLVANATKALLDSIDGIEVIGVVGNGQQCMELVSLHQPGLVFLDYHLPVTSGMEVAAQIKHSYPDTHIVIFTGVDLTGIYLKSIELGVSGVLSKESSERTIKNMVNCILDGYTMLPLSFYRNIQFGGAYAREDYALNEEELLMMNMVVKGATYEQIADRIHTSKRTVDNYLRKIYEKLGAKSKAEALEKFIKHQHYS
ncbi:response regulator transcription factor [Paenibacillus piri]|uniref:Response regulator transcription factor n=1 Tax=Paenibacillus piri TaxID=2547395 RepID=A0A4R5KNP6_9BACL|nr:response regulator transcription factor [Paenibacillus piri]TDF96297.1 response regulator transcription factor [Paenibacillus piri]